MRSPSRSWRRFDAAGEPADLACWRQLFFAWLIFVVCAGVYHAPSTLLGGRCNATLPCSLAEEFHASPSALGWLPSTFLLVKGFLALPAGWIMHRFGTQKCILGGSILLLAATAGYAAAPAFWALPLLYSAFGIAYCLNGLTPLVVFCNSWFTSGRKATSIGLLVTGYSTAGVLWPTIVAAVAEAHGWRAAALLLPCATLCIALPTAWLLLRDGPEAGSGSSQHKGAAPPRYTTTTASTAACTSACTAACTSACTAASTSASTSACTSACSKEAHAHMKEATSTELAARSTSGDHTATPASFPATTSVQPTDTAAPNAVSARSASERALACDEVAACGEIVACGEVVELRPARHGVVSRLLPAVWLGKPLVWHLSAMSFYTLYLVNAVQHLLVTFLCSEEVGLTLTTAGLYASLVFAFSLVGKVAWGFALDRAWKKTYAITGCVLFALGGGLTIRPTYDAEEGLKLAAARSHAQLVPFAVTFGLGYGASFTLVQSRAAQLFGAHPSFAQLQSLLAVFQYLGSFVGVLLTSQLRDSTSGSFVRPFSLLPLIATLNTCHCVRIFRRAPSLHPPLRVGASHCAPVQA